MNMIEVDPKLFITCRLCLDEMGLYQIVPKVQMQIKYCFEIDVEPFDGLPQLICKKCESILSQYAGIKQMYQVKQNSLKTLKKSGQEEVPEEKVEELQENTVQQQDTVSSTQQVESVKESSSPSKKTNRYKLSLTKRARVLDCESSSSKSNEPSTPIEPAPKNEVINKPINKPKKEKSSWTSDYIKRFKCRFCLKSFSRKRYITSHINKHEDIIMKYSNILNNHCEIRMNKVGSTLNLTKSDNNVVLNMNKIINSVNSKYYILYSSNFKTEGSSSESDDMLIRTVTKKYKRQRLLSEDSISAPINTEKDNSQPAIDINKQSQINNSVDCDDQKSESFIDCVNIDSDSNSTQSNITNKVSDTEKPQEKCINKKLIGNIITMCYKKYLKRFDNSKNVSKPHGSMDSFLQHKVLSIGTKIIHNKGLNSMGLLRYLEHKNLDVSWTQMKNSNSSILVQTSLVNAKSNDTDVNDLGWRSLNEMDQNLTTEDFVDMFEKNIPPELSPALNQEIEEPPKVHSVENNIEIEISKNKLIISPITLNEKNTNQEKNITNAYNPPQSTSVAEASDNAVLLLRTLMEGDKQTCRKILNANPVPYPKQLPTKKSNVHEPPSVLKSPTHPPMEAPRIDATFVNFNNEVPHMPVITSTVSLAPVAEDQRQKQTSSTSQVTSSNKNETNLPQIKVKPISELMPDKSVQNNSALVNMGWTVTSGNNESVVLHATNSNLVYVANVPQYTNVAPQQSAPLCYPQILCSVSQVNPGEAAATRQPCPNDRNQRKNQEFVHMHTVELPNNKTTSPFRYFQRLLQIHNLVLLESTVSISYVSTNLKCLIKFSLGFQQENNAPVTLCLTLYCDKNVFCIKVRDNASKDIDVSKLSANWQWEILKVFKGDIVSKLNLNALKHGLDMSSKVNHFVSLLKAIVFSKEK